MRFFPFCWLQNLARWLGGLVEVTENEETCHPVPADQAKLSEADKTVTSDAFVRFLAIG
jgi:hypothetical protein